MVGQYGTHVDPRRRISIQTASRWTRSRSSQMILPLVVFQDTKYFDHEPNHRLTVDTREWEKTNRPVPKRLASDPCRPFEEGHLTRGLNMLK
jgi:hypothetical protein